VGVILRTSCLSCTLFSLRNPVRVHPTRSTSPYTSSRVDPIPPYIPRIPHFPRPRYPRSGSESISSRVRTCLPRIPRAKQPCHGISTAARGRRVGIRDESQVIPARCARRLHHFPIAGSGVNEQSTESGEGQTASSPLGSFKLKMCRRVCVSRTITN
jgi:hypothetical protein